MSASPPRGPDEILGELGRRLDRAYLDAPRTRRARWLVAAVAAVALAGPTAVATHDAIFAPAPPPAPPQARGGAGAVQPDAVGAPINVARGTRHAIAWQMSASLCRYGTVQAVGLFLDVPGGGAGARCDVASRTPGAAPPPVALGERRTQTYIDPVSGRTWVFGVLPATAASAVVSSRRSSSVWTAW
jgi:hypothetical protein